MAYYIMEPATILAITSISAVGIGILGKVLYTLRHNVKNLCGIVFRTPESQSRHSPRLTQLNVVRDHLENTLPAVHITPAIKNDDSAILDLEKQIRIKELEMKLKDMDEERIYI